MVTSKELVQAADVIMGIKAWAEYWEETVAAGYLDASGCMLLERAKELKREEDEEEAKG